MEHNARWGKYVNETEWKLGRVRIMLQTRLLSVPLENTNNLYNHHTTLSVGIIISFLDITIHWEMSNLK